MVALGLLERHGERYQNGPAAAKYLSGTGPGRPLPLAPLLESHQLPDVVSVRGGYSFRRDPAQPP